MRCTDDHAGIDDEPPWCYFQSAPGVWANIVENPHLVRAAQHQQCDRLTIDLQIESSRALHSQGVT